MECPNCAFHNTPGTPSCVRCASRLDFSGVDVIPLRAPRGAAARRLSRGLGVVGFGVRDLGRHIGGDLRTPRWLDRSWEGITPGELLQCVIPGLVHVRRGHRALGRSLMGAWLALLLLALLTIGSRACWLAILGAIGLHCTAVGLLFSGVLESMSIGRRLLVGLLVYVCVVGLLYYPAYWGMSRLFRIVPVATQVPSSVVRAGDVLVAAGPAFGPPTPRRGDVVLYRTATINGSGFIIRGGAWLDRVLGIPGDRVEVRAGAIFVNGDPIPDAMMPLGSAEHCPDLDMLAGPRQYIILPTLVDLGDGAPVNSRYRALVFTSRCVIDAGRIESVISFRIRPWLRAGGLSRQGPSATQGATP